MFGSHEPQSTGSIMGGVQHKFKFANGYGASVVSHHGSYGGDAGLWEVAVLGADGRLTYDTPVTDDVVGWLPNDEVAGILDQIAGLNAEVSA